MAYIDDRLLDDPRMAKAGPFGFMLHTAALLWCSRNRTDTIPMERVECLLDTSAVMWDSANPSAVASGPSSMGGNTGLDVHQVAMTLAEVGLWELVTMDQTVGGKTAEVIGSYRLLDVRAVDDAPRLSRSELLEHVQVLGDVLGDFEMGASISKPSGGGFVDATQESHERLVTCLDKVHAHLKAQLVRE